MSDLTPGQDAALQHAANTISDGCGFDPNTCYLILQAALRGHIPDFADDLSNEMLIAPSGRCFTRDKVTERNVNVKTQRCYGCGQAVGNMHQGLCPEERCPACHGLLRACRCTPDDMPTYTPAQALRIVKALAAGLAVYRAWKLEGLV